MIWYFVIFLFLVIIFGITLTWTLYIYYQENLCRLDSDFWCSNNWTCNNLCFPTEPNVSTCYSHKDNLANCLFGPESQIATVCFVSPPGDDPDSLSCPCTTNAANCMSNCPQSISDANTTKCCCNDPLNPNCNC